MGFCTKLRGKSTVTKNTLAMDLSSATKVLV